MVRLRVRVGSGSGMVGIVICSVIAGCSSSGGAPGAPGPGDSGALDSSVAAMKDSSVPPVSDASDAAASEDVDQRATACTAAPYVNFAGTLTTLYIQGAAVPRAGAMIGFSTCPGFVITTDAMGAASTQLTKGIPVSPIYNGGTTVVAAVGAEIPAMSDLSAAVTLFALDVIPAIPGFAQDGGNAPTIAITLVADSAAPAPCNDLTGVTLAVTGHPEAVVSYANTGWPSDPTVTTTSSAGPYVFIGGVVGSSRVTVTGEKTGCTVKLATPSQTGSFLLVPGSVTVGVATVAAP